MWKYIIDFKKEFIPRKEKIYFLFQKSKRESKSMLDTVCILLSKTYQ